MIPISSIDMANINASQALSAQRKQAEAIKKLADAIEPIIDQFIRATGPSGLEDDHPLFAAKEAIAEARRLIE